MPASQASRRAVSGAIGPAKASSPPATPRAPRAAQRANQSMVTRIWAAAPRTRGLLDRCASARRARSTSASPIRSRVGAAGRRPGRSPFISASERGVHGLPPPIGSRCPEQVDPSVGADRHPEDPRHPGRVVAGAPSGSIPATPRRTALAVSSGPSSRAASMSTASVIAELDAVGLGDGHAGARRPVALTGRRAPAFLLQVLHVCVAASRALVPDAARTDGRPRPGRSRHVPVARRMRACLGGPAPARPPGATARVCTAAAGSSPAAGPASGTGRSLAGSCVSDVGRARLGERAEPTSDVVTARTISPSYAVSACVA